MSRMVESVSQPPDLEPLLSPDSVAVVGASPDSWYSSQLMNNLLDYGFEGDVYPVNPSRNEAWGRRCYDTLADLPETVDLAVVSVPREYVIDTVRDAGELDVPAALVITAGFGEADEEGAQFERELAEIADEYGVHVCGPNCIGLANAVEGTVLTSTCSRAPEPGSVGLVSQSGALAFTTFYERATDEDIHFAYLISTGNEVDLTLTDYVDYLADQPEVDVVCAYVEGIEDPLRFMRVVDEAVRSGTPVLTVKVGQSDIAEAATLSHTGSLTGSDAAWEAAFEQTSVERVPDVPDLLARASAHTAFDPPESNRVCVASTSGGLASLLADMAAERGLELPDIAGDTERRLLDMENLLTFEEMHNPADIRGYGAEVLPEIAESLFDDDSFDAYVFAIGLPAVDEAAARIADDLLTVSRMTDDPVLFLWTGRKEPADLENPQPYERVQTEVPLYYDPGRCLDAVASLVDAGEGERQTSPSRTELEEQVGNGPDLDLPEGRVLTWEEARPLLEAYDVPVPETEVATSADEAVDCADELGYPVVIKVDSPDIPHRTDADAVVGGVEDEAEVHGAYEIVVGNVADYDPDAKVNGVLVQPQVDEGVEALLGVSEEEGFGSVVTVGPGGTLVEVLEDTAVRVPPLSAEDARSAVEETALDDLLVGHRGDEAGDKAAFISLAERVGLLAAEVDGVVEIDFNPVVVHEEGEGVTALDVLVRTE
ncbi:acetate--CoA ligase family protein [Halegenticoccus soli]|uniref:acetate--CoA ligase family protein n=1 Tax=Halegenticoccus soli TaxID=1985678 RepID=UPI000C6DB2A9|nr:acetate--CoA ligase family protein [Halegenticoccus soli]